uniref:Uncharacterized protein n=1 Tax=Kuenenia stuttgartiensis TaxID=174633 RepID=Q1PXX2_KUEST|nr:unknown protein [Candidatus Kuenenia stuttgartiensis]
MLPIKIKIRNRVFWALIVTVIRHKEGKIIYNTHIYEKKKRRHLNSVKGVWQILSIEKP